MARPPSRLDDFRKCLEPSYGDDLGLRQSHASFGCSMKRADILLRHFQIADIHRGSGRRMEYSMMSHLGNFISDLWYNALHRR